MAAGGGGGMIGGEIASLLQRDAQFWGGLGIQTHAASKASDHAKNVQMYFQKRKYLFERNALERGGYNPILAMGASPPSSAQSASFMPGTMSPGSGTVSTAAQRMTAAATAAKAAADVKVAEKEKWLLDEKRQTEGNLQDAYRAQMRRDNATSAAQEMRNERDKELYGSSLGRELRALEIFGGPAASAARAVK